MLHRLHQLAALAALTAGLGATESFAEIDWNARSVQKIYSPQTEYQPANPSGAIYSYAASVIRTADGVEHYWSCHNTTAQETVDSIVYFSRNSLGTVVQSPISVLGNCSNEVGSTCLPEVQVKQLTHRWDAYHLCDPSVTRGSFKLDGAPFSIALFYLGSMHGTSNQIGVAFTNSFDPNNAQGKYKRVPFPVVTASASPQYGNCPARPDRSAPTEWGVGQPSVTSVSGGRVLVFYTTGSTNTHGRVALLDLSNVKSNDPSSVMTLFDRPVTRQGLKGWDGLAEDDVLNNFEVAYEDNASDPNLSRFFMIRPQYGHGALTSALEVASIPSGAIWSDCDSQGTPAGTWTPEATINTDLTGLPDQGEAAFERNEWGSLSDASSARVVFASTSYRNPDGQPYFPETNNYYNFELWEVRGTRDQGSGQNLALTADATVSTNMKTGGFSLAPRGSPYEVLYDTMFNRYATETRFNEFGTAYRQNLGVIGDGVAGAQKPSLYWQVEWASPKVVGYVSFGGAYPNQPQPHTGWKVKYLSQGTWTVLASGTGGWMDGQANPNLVFTHKLSQPVSMSALRLELSSSSASGGAPQPVKSPSIRARGGVGATLTSDDRDAAKAVVIQSRTYSVGQQ